MDVPDLQKKLGIIKLTVLKYGIDNFDENGAVFLDLTVEESLLYLN
jgi:hypothetical protein